MSTQLRSEESKNLFLPWMIWGTIALFYFYQFLLRVSPSVIADDLMRDLNIHACSLGELASYYYIGYTTMQIPVGLLIDRIGIRKPLVCAILLCVLGCYLFATNESYFMLSLGRGLMGIGSAFAFLSCVKSGALWFKPCQLGLLVGLTLMLGTAGGAAGGPGISFMLELMTWRHIFVFFLIVGFLLSILAWYLVKDYSQSGDNASDTRPLSILKALHIVLKNPQTYIFGFYGGLMYIPLSAFADMWGTPYLIEAYQVSKSVAASTVSMMYLGIGLGSPLAAYFSDRLRSHKKVMLIGALLGMIFMVLCLYIKLSFSIMYILYFIFGFSLGVQFLAYASVCQMNPLAISGTASAIQNIFAMVSGIIFQPLLGKLLDTVWDGTMVNQTPHYSEENFVYALTLIPITLLFAVILCLIMKETYPQD